MAEIINLEGRMAKCICGTLIPSVDARRMYPTFFTYRGPGSQTAVHICKHCRYYDVAHTDENRRRNQIICDQFEPIGDVGTDEFYNGCEGWD